MASFLTSWGGGSCDQGSYRGQIMQFFKGHRPDVRLDFDLLLVIKLAAIIMVTFDHFSSQTVWSY